MSARVYFMKRVMLRFVYYVSARWTVKTDKFTLFVYCNFLVLLSTTECSQNINKQNVNIADETLTDYSILSRYHYTKSNELLKKAISNSSLNSHVYWAPCTINIQPINGKPGQYTSESILYDGTISALILKTTRKINIVFNLRILFNLFSTIYICKVSLQPDVVVGLSKY